MQSEARQAKASSETDLDGSSKEREGEGAGAGENLRRAVGPEDPWLTSRLAHESQNLELLTFTPLE